MSKNRKIRKSLASAAAAPAAPAADIDRCACGWELPCVGLRFADPAKRPAFETLRGFVITFECPVCGTEHEDPIFGAADEATSDPLRIRCNQSILYNLRYSSIAIAA